MFNGYTWQTRILEVRLDRLMPEYELGRVGIGTGVGVAIANAQGLGSAVSGTPSIAGGSGPLLGLGIGGSGSVGGAANSTNPALGSGLTTFTTDTGLSTDLSLLAGFNNPLPNPSLRAPHLSVPSRPSSSSAALQDPLDFLHSSGFTSGATESQSTDPATNRTLFVGNVCYPCRFLFRFLTCCFHITAPVSYPMARFEGSVQASGYYPPRGCCSWSRQSISGLRHRHFCHGSRCREGCSNVQWVSKFFSLRLFHFGDQAIKLSSCVANTVI